MAKLKDILSEVFEDAEVKVNRKRVAENVKNFGHIGKSLYNNNNVMEIIIIIKFIMKTLFMI